MQADLDRLRAALDRLYTAIGAAMGEIAILATGGRGGNDD